MVKVYVFDFIGFSVSHLKSNFMLNLERIKKIPFASVTVHLQTGALRQAKLYILNLTALMGHKLEKSPMKSTISFNFI